MSESPSAEQPLQNAGAHGRQRLSRHLFGLGLEVGPGDSPFPLSFAGATARYVDRWGRQDNERLFKEIVGATFADPHLLVDLNVDRLSAFADCSQDFIIASHVLEHLVEPLGQLKDMYRVLRPGGTLLLLLPDRRRTFNRTRPPTSLSHLVDEYERNVTELDDAHIEEFVAHVPEDWSPDVPPKDRAEQFERHRQRSIHVHCWTEDEFAEVISHCIQSLHLQWELVDRLLVDEGSIEFGITLRRSSTRLPPETAAAHFGRAWHDLSLPSSAQVRLEAALAEHGAVEAAAAEQIRSLTTELATARALIAPPPPIWARLRGLRLGSLLRRTGWRGPTC